MIRNTIKKINYNLTRIKICYICRNQTNGKGYYSTREIVRYNNLENIETTVTINVSVDNLNDATAETLRQIVRSANTVPTLQNLNTTPIPNFIINNNIISSIRLPFLSNYNNSNVSFRNGQFTRIVERITVNRIEEEERTTSGEEKLIEKVEEIAREKRIQSGGQFEGVENSMRLPYPRFNNITYERLGMTPTENRFYINEIYCHFNVIKRWIYSTVNRQTHLYTVQRPNNIQEQLIVQHARRIQEQGYSVNMEALIQNVTTVLIKADGFYLLIVMIAILALVKRTYLRQIPVRIIEFIKKKLKVQMQIQIRINKIAPIKQEKKEKKPEQYHGMIEIIREQTENIEWMVNWLLFNKMVNTFIKRWKDLKSKVRKP